MSDEAATGRSVPDSEMATPTVTTTPNRKKSRLKELFHRNKKNSPSTASSTHTLGGLEQQSTQFLPNRTTPSTQNLTRTEEAAVPLEIGLESSGQGPVIQNPVKAQAARPIAEVWGEAWNALDPDLVQAYEEYIGKESHTILNGLSSAQKTATSFLRLDNIQKHELQRQLVDQKTKELEDDKWKVKFKGNEFVVKDMIAPVVGVVEWAKDYIGSAANASPYTSVAWAGVSLILPLLLNPGKQSAARAKGLEKIAGLLRKCTIREEVYRRRYECGKQDVTVTVAPIHDAYREEVKKLYTLILTFEATCLQYLLKNLAQQVARDITAWDDWGDLSAQILEQETVLEGLERQFDSFRLQEQWEHRLKEHEDQIKALDLIGSEITRLRKLIKDAQNNSERTTLLKWLCKVDPSSNYNSAWKEHESSTGDWLVKQNLRYQNWKKSPKSFLWLHGKGQKPENVEKKPKLTFIDVAGAGKSFLSASVIHDLEPLVYENPDHALAYFYFDFSDTEKRNTDNMLCSIIQQLCAARLDTPKALLDLDYYKDKNQRPHIDKLKTTIDEALTGFNQVYIVLDALDECPLKERKTLLTTLDHLHKQGTAPVHFFCTSRKEHDIQQGFEKFNHQLEFNLEDLKKEVDADIGLFITQWIFNSKFNSCNDDIKGDIKRILVEKADGMFRYVALQLDALQTCSTAKADVTKLLEGLPEGLDETYERILEGLHKSRQEQVFRLLSWMTCSKQTLSLIELAEATITDPAGSFNPEKRFANPKDALDDITTLVTVFSKSELSYSDEEVLAPVLYVRFAHFSVQEYLISEKIKTSPVKKFSINYDSANVLIANACLYYHIQASQATKIYDVITTVYKMRKFDQFPLWNYAAEYWMANMEAVLSEFWPTTLRERAKTVLTTGADALLYMVIIHDPSKPDSSGEIELNGLAFPLFYVSAAGCHQLLTMLLQDKSPKQITEEINTVWQQSFATALQAACYLGHEKVIRLLIENFADINVQGGEYGNALQAAAYSGNLEIVKLLLHENLANVNAQGGLYGNALQAAALAGDHTIVQLLLESGANVNAKGGKYGSALQAAAWAEAHTVVELLVDRGADVNAQGGLHGNALQAATLAENHKIIEILLRLGADVNAQGGDHGSALQAAAWVGDHTTVKLLLKHGADVSSQGGLYGSALQAAAKEKRYSLVELLLECGADVNAQGGQYGNALHAAAWTRDHEMVKLLLEHDADANAQGERYSSALLAAMNGLSSGLVPVISLLLDHGAEVDTSGKDGTALQYAISTGKFEVVRLLLSHNATLSSNSRPNIQALHADTVYHGDGSMIELLLEYGFRLSDISKGLSNAF